MSRTKDLYNFKVIDFTMIFFLRHSLQVCIIYEFYRFLGKVHYEEILLKDELLLRTGLARLIFFPVMLRNFIELIVNLVSVITSLTSHQMLMFSIGTQREEKSYG